MAWRNLWRNRRRTFITLAGFSFGLMLAILFIGLGDHTYGKTIDLAARMGNGHVTLQHEDYLDQPALKRRIHATDDLLGAARSAPTVTHVVPRISGAVMLSTAKNSVGTAFVAIDPAQESEATLATAGSLADGRWLESPHDKGILLGSKLASMLEVELGRKVVYTLTSEDGEIVSGLAKLVGIIETGAADADRSICILSIDRVRELVGFEPDEVTAIAVFLGDQRTAESTARALQAEAPPGVAALPWPRTMPDIAGYVAVDQGGNYVLQVIIMALVAAGIFNSLFVSVLERQREFGVMLAVGFAPTQLFLLLMLESWWMSLSGLVIGGLVTAVPYYLLHTYGLDLSKMYGDMGDLSVSGVGVDLHMYVSIHPEKLLVLCLVAIGVTLIAGLYPAWRASRVPPVEAIKLI